MRAITTCKLIGSSRTLLVSAVVLIASVCLVFAAGNRFLKYVGNWGLYLGGDNACTIGVTVRLPDQSLLHFVITSPDVGTLDPNDPLYPLQIEIWSKAMTPAPDAATKKATLDIGDTSFAGVIFKMVGGEAMFLFVPRSKIFAELSKTGDLTIISDYYKANFPFPPLKEQVNALLECERTYSRDAPASSRVDHHACRTAQTTRDFCGA